MDDRFDEIVASSGQPRQADAEGELVVFEARRDLCQGELLAACRARRLPIDLLPEKLKALRESMQGRARAASLNQRVENALVQE